MPRTEIGKITGWRVVINNPKFNNPEGRNVFVAKKDDLTSNSSEPAYLHADGTWHKTTIDPDGNYSGWFETVEEAQKAIDRYFNSTGTPLSEEDFISKWKGSVTGWWANDVDTLFWARAYRMPPDMLKSMCRDYMLTLIENRAYCCLDVVKRTLR